MKTPFWNCPQRPADEKGFGAKYDKARSLQNLSTKTKSISFQVFDANASDDMDVEEAHNLLSKISAVELTGTNWPDTGFRYEEDEDSPDRAD